MSVNIFENGILKRVAGNIKDFTLLITNHLNATETGTALDAVQGKVLSDKIKEVGVLASSLQSEIDTKVNKVDVLTTMEEINANTNENALAGAMAVKEGIDNLNNSLYYSAITYPLDNGYLTGILAIYNRAGYNYEIFVPYPAIRHSKEYSISQVILQGIAILSDNWTDISQNKSESGIHIYFNYPTDLSAYIGSMVDVVVTIKYYNQIYD